MNEYIGNPLQIRGAEQYMLQDGAGNGMRFLCVRNGWGLRGVDLAGSVRRSVPRDLLRG